MIIGRIHEAIIEGKRNQLLFVEGEAGTGKTVLMSSTFYELLESAPDLYEMEKPLRCALMVNHDEQITVYEEISRKLHLKDKYGSHEGPFVCKPTHFINSVSPETPVDVAFIDEGHLLLTQGKMAFTGQNQLFDIMARARVTVVMFDENQVLTAEEYWEREIIEGVKDIAIKQGNMVCLSKQLRMACAPSTMAWRDGLTKRRVVEPLPMDPTGYEVKVFDSPRALYKAIEEKAAKEESRLSRVVATYDWEYHSDRKNPNGDYWGVRIGSFFLPWNRELEDLLPRKEKRANKNLAWAEQPQTIGEAGSTFTIQGFDLSYVGVIIGPSVTYENGVVTFNPEKSHSEKATQRRMLVNGKKVSLGKELLPHELRVLLTRGVNGLYIYACDPELAQALKDSLPS